MGGEEGMKEERGEIVKKGDREGGVGWGGVV